MWAVQFTVHYLQSSASGYLGCSSQNQPENTCTATQLEGSYSQQQTELEPLRVVLSPTKGRVIEDIHFTFRALQDQSLCYPETSSRKWRQEITWKLIWKVSIYLRFGQNTVRRESSRGYYPSAEKQEQQLLGHSPYPFQQGLQSWRCYRNMLHASFLLSVILTHLFLPHSLSFACWIIIT